jgi:UDP-N-acetylglucosamine--N-acetylmuramyl-(pentapeptide) pyrophosphoryl-undecaprenol N-acetylglucosamine transferase
MMKQGATIVIMAGGTGGHVFPALAVAEQLRAKNVPVVWLGTRRGLEAKLVPPTGIPLEWIGVAGLRGSGVTRLLMAPLMIGKAVWQAATIFRRIKPQVVLGMGGFVSGPGGLVAWLLGIPLVVHEQNAIPGLTNRWLARLANRVLEGFPHSFSVQRQALWVGNPVRTNIVALPEPAERLVAHTDRTHLLVVGGSQGALALNQLVPAALTLMTPGERPDVWHQAGGNLWEAAAQGYQKTAIEVRLEPFIEVMADAYRWADLVLCRSGALTVAELAAAGVGSILVPFPHAVDDHQTVNGRFLEREGAAVLIPQKTLTAQRLAELLGELLNDRPRLHAMAKAARRLARADAAQRVAEICLAQAGCDSR